MTEHNRACTISVSLAPRFHPANLPMAEEALRDAAGRFGAFALSRRSSHRFEMVVQEGEWRRKGEILKELAEEYGGIFRIEEKIG